MGIIPKSNEEIINEQHDKLKAQFEYIQEVEDHLRRIDEAGLECAAVIRTTDKHAILSTGIYALNKDYKVGQNVLVYPRTGQVMEVLPDIPLVGELFYLDKVLDDGYAELRIKGERIRVFTGEFKNLKEGDVVLLDRHHTIVQALIERVSRAPKISNPVTWDMIGGNAEAKQLLIEAIELPHKHPKLYKTYKKQNAKGVLLFGAPGCGKTMLGKATATSVGAEDGFIAIKGPEVLNCYIGNTEANIRAPFLTAKAFKEATGKPAVIFVDEAESLLTMRGQHHNYMGQTVVPAFLAEMDGLDDSGAIVILSTNRDDMIDPAILREGRIDFKVEVQPPNAAEAKEIMIIHMDGKPIHVEHDGISLVEMAVEELYNHRLPHSGALLAGCVNKAVTHALRRDIATGKLSGLHEVDFKWATQQIIKQELKPNKAIQDASATW